MTTQDPGPGAPVPPYPAQHPPQVGGYPGQPGAYPGQPGAYPGQPGASPAQRAGYPAPPPPWGHPGAPVPPGWSPPPTVPTDGLAVASLAVSGAGVLTAGLTGPVGLGLGIAALRRIRRTRAQGHGLAVAGVVVGAVMTGVLLLVVAAGVLGARSAAGSASPAAGPEVADDWPGGGADATTSMPPYRLTEALVPGDCLATAPETYDMSDAVVVDCATAHETEVLEQLFMSEPVLADVTEPDAAYSALLDRCAAVLEHLVDPAVLPEETWADVYFPHPDAWYAGDQSDAYCVLTTLPAGTGSARAGTFLAGPGTEV